MKRYCLSQLVCPLSGEPLQLIAIKEKTLDLSASDKALLAQHNITEQDASTAIEEGILYTERSGYWYPIINFIPVLLDFSVDIHADFRERHGARYPTLTSLKSPDGVPREGELFVQKSFTREWSLIDLDVISFGLTPQQRDLFISLELDWPSGILDRENLRVLEVGCGSGFESLSLHRVTRGPILGFDLNLALLQKGHLLADNPFINNSICSLFRLPLRPKTFDIVYSSGTLHHTYSTLEALKEILKFRSDDGLIYMWVYAREDSDYSLRARFTWLLEDIFRPRIAKLPDFWQNLVVGILARHHYRMYKRVGGYNRDKWRYKDSQHFIRDLWTPLFAHRQSFNETIRWFLELGMEYRLIDPKNYYDRLNWPLIGIGIRGILKRPSAEETEQQLRAS
jgi:uncharacterized protein YbaR (Trm112 family)/ubiquinone/menaquinone biosynthesis C-methylase UbiE